MIAALRSALAFLGLLLLAIWFVPLGGFFLHQVFIGERILSVPFGWLSWSDLLRWSYLAICFIGLGALLYTLGIVPRPALWAIVFGSSFSLVRFIGSHHWFSDTAHWSAFLWAYGEFFVPPLAALAGSIMARRWFGARANNALAA